MLSCFLFDLTIISSQYSSILTLSAAYHNQGCYRDKDKILTFLSYQRPGIFFSAIKRMRFTTSVQNKIAALLVMASIISGISTYAAFTETPPFGNDPNTVIWLLNLDLVLALMLVALIARRIVGLWSGRKRGIAGSHLHVRLVYIFSILAAVPAIVMTIFSAYFFHFGVQTWFSERVQTAVNEAQAVAEAYLKEHTQVIRADTLAMAYDLSRQAHIFIANDEALDKVLKTQSILRNLSEAIVIDEGGRVYARSGLTFSLELENVPLHMLERASTGEVVVMTSASDDRVRALVKLENFVDRYLFVGRLIDPQVLSHLASTKKATEEYLALRDRYSGLQITVTMMFVVVGMLLLACAIWFGLMLARQLVSPITGLIDTADRVRAGDLSARVDEKARLQEFEYLAKAFNRMTKQIQEQQNQLLETNRKLDRRRHFTETVLTGVSSGVLGVDEHGIITVANSSAYNLLSDKNEEMIGKEIASVLPDILELLDIANDRPDKVTQGELILLNSSKDRRIYLVRIAIEDVGDEEAGAILTFDDITDLQSAQRKAAWADVARRIAHEIKNPLTPIQLSAERLKRKYLKQIESDADIFEECTDTIIRHVSDIGRMVNEFSSFARMPEPRLKRENVEKQIRESLFLHKQAHPQINFNVKQHEELFAQMDEQQFRQVLTNLVQNAVDSIEMRAKEKPDLVGEVNVRLARYDEEQLYIIISDNGLGFPVEEDKANLIEPYITHKPKGTGLGLAIVKKIMDDHNGRIILGAPSWLAEKNVELTLDGAVVVLLLPIDSE